MDLQCAVLYRALFWAHLGAHKPTSASLPRPTLPTPACSTPDVCTSCTSSVLDNNHSTLNTLSTHRDTVKSRGSTSKNDVTQQTPGSHDAGQVHASLLAKSPELCSPGVHTSPSVLGPQCSVFIEMASSLLREGGRFTISAKQLFLTPVNSEPRTSQALENLLFSPSFLGAQKWLCI